MWSEVRKRRERLYWLSPLPSIMKLSPACGQDIDWMKYFFAWLFKWQNYAFFNWRVGAMNTYYFIENKDWNLWIVTENPCDVSVVVLPSQQRWNMNQYLWNAADDDDDCQCRSFVLWKYWFLTINPFIPWPLWASCFIYPQSLCVCVLMCKLWLYVAPLDPLGGAVSVQINTATCHTHKCWDFSLSLKLGSHASPSQLQPAYTRTFLTGLRPDCDYLEHNLFIWHICIVIGQVWPLSQCSMWSDSSLLCSIINTNQLLFIFFPSARSHSTLAASQEMVWNSCSSKFGLSSSSSKDLFSSAWLILAVHILWV